MKLWLQGRQGLSQCSNTGDFSFSLLLKSLCNFTAKQVRENLSHGSVDASGFERIKWIELVRRCWGIRRSGNTFQLVHYGSWCLNQKFEELKLSKVLGLGCEYLKVLGQRGGHLWKSYKSIQGQTFASFDYLSRFLCVPAEVTHFFHLKKLRLIPTGKHVIVTSFIP